MCGEQGFEQSRRNRAGVGVGFFQHLASGALRAALGPQLHPTPPSSMAFESQLLQFCAAWRSPLNCLIHLEPTCPSASQSRHTQDAYLSPRPRANPTLATTVGALPGSAQAVPRHSPQAQIRPHKAAIIVNRLSQILCVPRGTVRGMLGPQPCMGFWAPEGHHSVSHCSGLSQV